MIKETEIGVYRLWWGGRYTHDHFAGFMTPSQTTQRSEKAGTVVHSFTTEKHDSCCLTTSGIEMTMAILFQQTTVMFHNQYTFVFFFGLGIVFKCPIPSHCRAIYELMWTHAGDMNSPTEKRTSVRAVGRLDQSLNRDPAGPIPWSQAIPESVA